MKKILTVFTGTMLALFLLVNIASAHVTVSPGEVEQGTYQKFTFTVPSEKEGTTTAQVKVAVPDGVEISRVKPVTGWDYTFEKNDSGKVTAIIWKAVDQGLSSQEFAEFTAQGKVADDAKQLKFKAYQTYDDGTVVKWIGGEDSDHPAPMIQVSAAKADANQADQTTEPNDSNDTSSSVPLYLSIAALVIGLISLITVFVKK